MSDINIDNETIENLETDVVIESDMGSTKTRNNKPEQSKKVSAQKNSYKSKKCNILWYEKENRKLAVSFGGYGIYIKNVDSPVGDTVVVKYKGEIGKSNFEYWL